MPVSAKSASPKKRKTAKKKTTTPEQRVKRLVGSINKKLRDLTSTKKLVKEFEETLLPKFDSWFDETFDSERAAVDSLEKEVDVLEHALRALNTANRFGDPIRGKDVDILLEEVGERYDEALSEAEGFGPEDIGKEENPFRNCDEIPDFVVDEMFESMMASVLGIDVDEMERNEFLEARQQFEESIKHIQNGDKNAFEKAVIQIGADKSEENVSAVKKAFRRLARQLHPDRNPDFGEDAQELWGELKLGKEALDLEAIERIETHWRVLQKDEFAVKEEGKLKVFRTELNREFSDLRDDLAVYKAHPMWGKSDVEVSRGLKKEISAEFKEEITYLKEQKEGLLKSINQFKKVKSVKKKIAPKAKKKPLKKQAKPAAKRTVPGELEQTLFDF